MDITLQSEKEYCDYMQNHEVTPCANEEYCMQLYIKYLCSIGKGFPIRIEKRERPDFVLQIDDTEIGLEHTRASCRTQTYMEKKLDDYPEGSMLEIPDCQHATASKESIREVIRRPGEPLQSAGWGNWGAEKYLIDVIIKSIAEKTQKLNNGYEIYRSNELIMYDNLRIPGMRWDYVMTELRKQYANTGGRDFDKIHLVAEDRFWYDIMADYTQP